MLYSEFVALLFVGEKIFVLDLALLFLPMQGHLA